MRIRILIGAFLLALLCNLLCLPFWTRYDWKSLIATYQNREARFDIIYTGNKITAAEPVKMSCNIKYPPPGTAWTDKTRSFFITLPIHSKYQRISFTLTPIQNGKIDILLRGPFMRNEEDKAYPVLVDFKNLTVNGQVLFNDQRVLWHNKAFQTTCPINIDKPVTVNFEVRRHHFDRNDLDISSKIWFATTGNILSFLFFIRFLSWISRRKSVRGGGTDCVFLVIFFVSSFIPMISISEADKDFREQRMLAVKPELSEILRKKADYGKRFDDWYNDHFGGRNLLVKTRDAISFHVNGVARAKRGIHYFKKDGWIFYPPLIYTSKIVNPVVDGIKKISEFCRLQNIKLYILEVPTKEVVYREFLYQFGFYERLCWESEQVQREVRDRVRQFGVSYIYPLKELRSASMRDYTFFKWTHHWTDWGGLHRLSGADERSEERLPGYSGSIS